MRMVVAFILFCLSSPGIADTSSIIPLFHPGGNPVDEYDSAVQALFYAARAFVGRPDQVRFGDNRELALRKALGVGNSSFVFGIGRGRAVRLAAKVEYLDRINDYLAGYQELKDSGVPVVRVYQRDSQKSQRVIVEELFPDPQVGRLITLSDFAEGRTSLSPALYDKLAENLVDFALRSFLVVRFADQGSRQILFTNRGWVLADFGAGTVFAKKPSDPVPFYAAPSLASRTRFDDQCGSLLTLMLYGLGQSNAERRVTVPPSLAERIRAAVRAKRERFFIK